MFGQRLNQIRHERRITAQQMADYLRMTIRSYRNYESGHRQPSLAILVMIADILDVSTDYLLGRDAFIEKNSKKDQDE